MNYTVRSARKHHVHIERREDTPGAYSISVDKTDYMVEIRKVQEDGTIKTLMVDHKVYPIEVERRGDGLPARVILKGVPYDVDISRVASARYKPPTPTREIQSDLRANLPGQVISILVKPGASVKKGDALLLLDAMKMENEILAHRDGTVRQIHVDNGTVVAKGDLLLEIE